MSKDPIKAHFEESLVRAATQASDETIKQASKEFFDRSHQLQYSYNFTWLSRPIIQYPQDIVAFQEVISTVQPDLIIETGIAHGGSLIFSASMMCLLDLMEGIDPRESKRKVVGIDIDIRSHNRNALDNHPLRYKIDLIEGSSIDQSVISEVQTLAIDKDRVLVSLDSNHTHDHVIAELEAYARLVSIGSYCIVFDTVIEDMPKDSFPDRPWDVGDNPKTAVHKWLEQNKNFEIDTAIDDKLLISVAPNGYLKRVA